MQNFRMSHLVVRIVTGRLEKVKGTPQFKAPFPRAGFSSAALPEMHRFKCTLFAEARDAICAALLSVRVAVPVAGTSITQRLGAAVLLPRC